jgi:dCMP deaminase
MIDLYTQTRWDKRFLELSKFIATWSKDPSTKVGAVIVEHKNSIVSLGFNGFPQLMNDDPKLYADREIKYSRVIHAEINAFVFARRPIIGCTLYTWPLPPCDRCAVQLIQAGVQRFVWSKPSTEIKERWGDALYKSKKYIIEAGLFYLEIGDSLLDG